MKRTLTVVEAAAELGVGAATLYRHLNGNAIELAGGESIKVVRIGSRVLVPAAEIARVLCEEDAS